MKLNEVASYRDLDPTQFTPEEIGTAWLRDKRSRGSIGEYFKKTDGTIDTPQVVYINKSDGAQLPVKFGKVRGFEAANSALISIDQLPTHVSSNISLRGSDIKSLSGIDKHVKYVGGAFYGGSDMENILGLLGIKGLDYINLDNGPIDKIMNKHLKNKDVLMAQHELINAGFDKQAGI
jgi:hypothetical protein